MLLWTGLLSKIDSNLVTLNISLTSSMARTPCRLLLIMLLGNWKASFTLSLAWTQLVVKHEKGEDIIERFFQNPATLIKLIQELSRLTFEDCLVLSEIDFLSATHVYFVFHPPTLESTCLGKYFFPIHLIFDVWDLRAHQAIKNSWNKSWIYWFQYVSITNLFSITDCTTDN